MNDKISVTTTNKAYSFPNKVKTILLYNSHATGYLYYNLDQNKIGICNTDDIILPPNSSRFLGKDELTKKRKIKHINLISSETLDLYIEYTTWAESPNENDDGIRAYMKIGGDLP